MTNKKGSTSKESGECEKCKAWNRVITQILGPSATELLEEIVEKELFSRKQKK